MKPWEIFAAGVALFLVLEWKPKTSAPATGVSVVSPPGLLSSIGAPAGNFTKVISGVSVTKPFYRYAKDLNVYRTRDGYWEPNPPAAEADGMLSDMSNVQIIPGSDPSPTAVLAPIIGTTVIALPPPAAVHTPPAPVAATPATPAAPRVIPVPASTSQAQVNQQLAAAGKPAYSVVVAVTGAGQTVVTPATNSVILPWDGGLYPAIPGAHKLLLPTGSIWNVNTANTAIQNQTAGKYRVTTAPDGTIIAVPTTATPTPVQTQVGQPVASGPVYSGPQNPLSKFGSQLFTGVWDSNPNPTSARIPDASGTGFVNV